MTENNLLSVLRLKRIPHIGDLTAKKLINHFGSPSELFAVPESELYKIHGVGTRMISRIKAKKYLEQAKRERDWMFKNQVRACYFQDKDYPEYLKQCADGPIVLFLKGNIRFNSGGPVLSIIGTRQSTRYAYRFCETLIRDLQPYNPIIISGLAYGTDIWSQRLAHEHGLQTIGCLAHGLDQLYPGAHQQDARNFMNNGGLLTECFSGTVPVPQQFLRRNRIIAGISQATLVLESGAKGGSLATANYANSYNREVFALPGRYNDPQSIGCNALIRNHRAQLLTSVEDLIYYLNWRVHSKDSDSLPEAASDLRPLSKHEQEIYQYLKSLERVHLDDLALGLSKTIQEISSLLFSMELKGIIRAYPGKIYGLK